MQTMEMVRTLFAYDAAQWRRVWKSVETLTPEQFAQETPYSHGSVRSQLFHVTEVAERWLRGLHGDANAYHFKLNPDDYATPEVLRAKWQEVSAATLAHVNDLPDADLEATLPGMMGPTWHILPHLVNHGTDHRAQTLAALHALGAPTFPQDLIHYLWFPERQ
jgi:uncharacterized damage-inducible protein DinB